jgi:putative transposase
LVTEKPGMMKAPSGQEHVVRKSKFTEEQIAFALKQAELGTRVEEVCR